MSKKNQEQNQSLSKLVSQVKVLSKTVEELEKEIEALKSKIFRNKDKKPTTSPSEPKKVANATPKSSRFRLKFFRKSDKTKENETPDDTSKKIEPRKKDDSTRDAISRNIPPNDRQPSIRKNYIDDSNGAEVKSKRKNELTQTSNQSTQIIKSRTQRQAQINYSKSDDCCCRSRGNRNNKNLKKSKKDKDRTKSKRRMCSDDCPYSSPRQPYYENTEKDSRRPFKNKKLMVNLIGSTRDFKNQTRGNKNFVLDCKFLQNADFAKLMDSKDDERRRKLKLFGCNDCGASMSSKKDCKLCSKNGRTKNVLKIRKAILTQEPPMIFISPDLEKSKICCGGKKHKKMCKKLLADTEDCCVDCCPSSEDEGAENSNSFECPCSSFAASINARYNKLCQTEISEKMKDYELRRF